MMLHSKFSDLQNPIQVSLEMYYHLILFLGLIANNVHACHIFSVSWVNARWSSTVEGFFFGTLINLDLALERLLMKECAGAAHPACSYSNVLIMQQRKSTESSAKGEINSVSFFGHPWNRSKPSTQISLSRRSCLSAAFS